MPVDHTERIQTLQVSLSPVVRTDTMVEAGRKVLLAEFIRMLSQEPGSRSGHDPEDVHQMRVAIRRMRSALRLLRPYLKRKAVRPFNRDLRRIAWTLGDVRDLDVMIDNLCQFQVTLSTEQQTGLQVVIDELRRRRETARENLVDVLDGKGYRRFVETFGDFLTTPGAGVKSLAEGDVLPLRVCDVLPALIFDRLAAVRAYDTVLAGADTPTLHALRIEFKRLRYLLSLFEDVLGKTVGDYIDQIKVIQDQLGHLNDASVAHARLDGLLPDLSDPAVLNTYFEHLAAHSDRLKNDFPEVWAHFNTRRVQQKLTSAVLALL